MSKVSDSLPRPNDIILPPAKKQALPMEDIPSISSPSRVLSAVSIKYSSWVSFLPMENSTNSSGFDTYMNNKPVLLLDILWA